MATAMAVVGEHSRVTSALLPSDDIDFTLLPAQRVFWRETVLFLDFMWLPSNQREHMLLGGKTQLYNNFCYDDPVLL